MAPAGLWVPRGPCLRGELVGGLQDHGLAARVRDPWAEEHRREWQIEAWRLPVFLFARCPQGCPPPERGVLGAEECGGARSRACPQTEGHGFRVHLLPERPLTLTRR